MVYTDMQLPEPQWRRCEGKGCVPPMPQMMQYDEPAVGLAGVILAGGQSRRMGEPKAGIRLPNGQTMLEHLLAVMAAVVPKIVVSGSSTGISPSGFSDVILLPDETPNEGPLSAINTVLKSGLAQHYLVLSCDQALILSEDLQALLSATPPEHLGFFEAPDGQGLDPFPALLPAAFACETTEAFQQGERSLRRLIQKTTRPRYWVSASAAQVHRLQSLNTPADLMAAGIR